jgi:hypothetical protein
MNVKLGSGQPLGFDPGALYHVAVRDADGTLLADTGMFATTNHGHPGEDITVLQATVPASGAASVEIVGNGVVLARQSRPASAPIVQILSPQGGEVIGQQPTTVVRWRTTAANNTVLTTKVDYSIDDGVTWQALFSGPNGNEVTLPSSYFASSRTGRVRVRVHDGFNDGDAVSERFSAVGVPPTVRILSPVDGQQLMQDATLYLSGEAYDETLTRLGANQLVWSVDGAPAGTGPRISISGLQAGSHRLQLMGTDAQGRTGTAEIRIDTTAQPIQAQVPPIELMLSPEQSSNVMGTSHSVTARVWISGIVQSNVPVTFAVIDGPNTGQSGTGATDETGAATFSYTGARGPGLDTVQASATFSMPDAASVTDRDTALISWAMAP